MLELKLCVGGEAKVSLAVDAVDWAKELLAARADRVATPHESRSSLAALLKAEEAAMRSATAASDAAAAASTAVSLSQHAAAWLRVHSPSAMLASSVGNGSHGFIRRHNQNHLSADLEIAAAESKDASATLAAISSANRAADDMRRAKSLAAWAKRTRQRLVELQRSPGSQAGTNSSHPAAFMKLDSHEGLNSSRSQAFAGVRAFPFPGSASSTKTDESEERLVRGERAAATTAGLCVFIICTVLAWFSSNIQDTPYRNRKSADDAVSFFEKQGWWMCCCCRRVNCLGRCVFNLLSWVWSCNCSTILLLCVLLAACWWGFRGLWDQHMIQPHLEEATVYLFVATIAFTIVLVLLGEFIRWLREKIAFVHNVASFVDDRTDSLVGFVKSWNGEDDSDDDLWDDPHSRVRGGTKTGSAETSEVGDFATRDKLAKLGAPRGKRKPFRPNLGFFSALMCGGGGGASKPKRYTKYPRGGGGPSDSSDMDAV